MVLSRSGTLYSTARLIRSARARGHAVTLCDPMELQLAVLGNKASVLYAGEPLGLPHVVVPRIGASITAFGVSVVRGLEEAGCKILNGADSIALSRDKVRSLEVLGRARVRVPRTISTRSLTGLERTVEQIGGTPAIVKLHNGTHGVGTMLAETRQALFALVETLCAMGHSIILQEFVREARGRDVRAFVVGGKVIAAMQRTAQKGEFRSNLHRGGTGKEVTLSRRFRSTAERAAKVLGLDVAGVDMLSARGEPIVLEVNSSPGLEGIEEVTEVDIAAQIIAHAEKIALERTTTRTKR